MGSWAIVAIPEKSDNVWDISSEKVPHMTILFLGEQSDPAVGQKVFEFLQHAVETILPDRKLWGEVQSRGTLGPDNADVIFFSKKYMVDAFALRNALLKDNLIRDLYNSTNQYPGWTPHVTLGYPTSPARKDPQGNSSLYTVQFDKIALWTGDFEGPEVELDNGGMDTPEEVSMADQTDAFFEHHGVKGMKWGVRRSQEQLSRAVTKTKSAYKGRQDQIKADKAREVSTEAATKRNNLRVARNAGTDRLSNKEMQDVITRMNLEQQYNQLTKGRNVKPSKRILRIITGSSKELATGVATMDPATIGKAVVGAAVKESNVNYAQQGGKKKK